MQGLLQGPRTRLAGSNFMLVMCQQNMRPALQVPHNRIIASIEDNLLCAARQTGTDWMLCQQQFHDAICKYTAILCRSGKILLECQSSRQSDFRLMPQ